MNPGVLGGFGKRPITSSAIRERVYDEGTGEHVFDTRAKTYRVVLLGGGESGKRPPGGVNSSGGNGGDAGELIEFEGPILEASVTFEVGAGGPIDTTAGAGPAPAGGNTRFGNLIALGGGVVAGRPAGFKRIQGGEGGAGGSGSGGGLPGSPGNLPGLSAPLLGGGSPGGLGGGGTQGGGGGGGDSPYGDGGEGGDGNSAGPGQDGQEGTGYGSGGGGGGAGNNAGPSNSGNGAPGRRGLIFVQEFA